MVTIAYRTLCYVPCIQLGHTRQLPSTSEQKRLLQLFHTKGHHGLFIKIWNEGYYWPTLQADYIVTQFASLHPVHAKTTKDVACTLYQVISDFSFPKILQSDSTGVTLLDKFIPNQLKLIAPPRGPYQ
ncbi:hypothetical protein QOT17_024336 [Balamuthia mandrillaris]